MQGVLFSGISLVDYYVDKRDEKRRKKFEQFKLKEKANQWWKDYFAIIKTAPKASGIHVAKLDNSFNNSAHMQHSWCLQSAAAEAKSKQVLSWSTLQAPMAFMCRQFGL